MVEEKTAKNEEKELLNRRFHFFLIGTSFLIAAFAVAVTSPKDGVVDSCQVLRLAHFVNAAGLYTALVFVLYNFYTASLISAQGQFHTPFELIRRFFRDLWRFMTHPLDTNRTGHADTWLVPFGFAVFWIIVWFVVLPDRWVPGAFGIGLPLFILGLQQTISTQRRKAMLFITLLSPKGKGEEAIKYLKEDALKAPKSIKVRDIYFTLGRYDGVIVFEAPDVKTAMDYVMKVGFATDYSVETLTAISAKEL